MPWSEFQKRKATPEEIKEWWKKWPDANVAIVTGEISKVSVVDIDSTEGQKEFLKFFPDYQIIPTANTPHGCCTNATQTAMTSDQLIEVVWTMKAQYLKGARWLFHRNAMTKIRKMKTGEGDYIWRMGLSDSKPDTILGFPYDESEYCPNVFTSGRYVDILANWKYYWIVDALDMEIQVLTEFFAATNENGYVARKETDGAAILEDGFVRVKLA